MAPQLDRVEFCRWSAALRASRFSANAYAELRERATLIRADDYVPGVFESFRRLVGEQIILALDLGLSPRSKDGLATLVVPTLDLTAMRKARDEKVIDERLLNDQIKFAEIFAVKLWAGQRKMMRMVRDERRVAIASCHASGKTFAAAILAFWFAASYEYAEGDRRRARLEFAQMGFV